MGVPWEYLANIYISAPIWVIAQPPQLNSSTNPMSRERDSCFSLVKAAPQGIQPNSKSQAVATKNKRCVSLTALFGQEIWGFVLLMLAGTSSDAQSTSLCFRIWVLRHDNWIYRVKGYGIPPGSMIRVHCLRHHMEYPVAPNAMASAVPLPAYGRKYWIQDSDRRFLSRSLTHSTIF